ncbi:MAG: hypothetical protein AAFU53_07895 [Cyanobacteria bacterium J06632_3]
MVETTYTPPVSKLLTYGDCREIDKQHREPERERILAEILADGLENITREKLAAVPARARNVSWPNYVEELGLTEAHVPELIRMATDDALNELPGDQIEVWAPVHAWRALGFLRAVESVEPLLGLLVDEFSDWLLEELPWVFGMIGEGAIAPVSLYLASRKHEEWARITTVSALEYIATLHPELKEHCIKKLGSQLADFRYNTDSLNGFLISSLIELEAREKAGLIERAYASGKVDESVCGNWPNVQIDMGLATAADFHPSELEPNFEWVKDEAPKMRRPEKPVGLELPTKQIKKKTSQVSGFGGSQTKSSKKKKKR